MRKIVYLLILLSVIGCSKKDTFVDVVNNALPQTVTIYVKSEIISPDGIKEGIAQGAGVYISSNGYVLTCAHLFSSIVSSGPAIAVETYGQEVSIGELVYIEPENDLAVVKTSLTNTSFPRLADTRDLKVGQHVFAIGAPLGNTFSVSDGIISALHRDTYMYNILQTNTNINPGNSGGPLFNDKGELVGINSFIESPLGFAPVFTGLGFSIESGQLVEFLVRFKNSVVSENFKLPKFKRGTTKEQPTLRYRLPYFVLTGDKKKC